ncbi:MAG TPA: hypothetical protein VFQ01_04525 [Nocardioides sp.]|nr:hypothetical protein [Nocardioides sp.]
MGTRQIQSKGLRSLHQFTQVRITTEQILDQLSSKSLFSTHSFAARFGITLGERCHRVVHHLQHRSGRGPHRGIVTRPYHGGQLGPYPSRCGQVQVDSPTYRDPLLGGAAALLSYCLDLGASGEPPERGRLREHRQVVAQEIARNATGILTGQIGNPIEPPLVID